MNIKKHIPRLMAVILSFSVLSGGVIPAYATDAEIVISESPLEGIEFDDAGQYVPENNEPSDNLETVSGNEKPISAPGHNYGEDDKCTDCGELNPNHEHSYSEAISKEATCIEAGEKTFTCVCGDSYTETIPAVDHSYENEICTKCGMKFHCKLDKVSIGDTETRVIAGQTLEFICIDDAYVDSTGETKGALFIAKDFIPGNILTMGVSNNSFVKDWGLNSIRSKLNGDTSDLEDLLNVDTTVTTAYSYQKTAKDYDMQTASSYGPVSSYSGTNAIDKVFILSLEEAIKYNKVNINGIEISTMWDLNCDGVVDLKSSSTGRYGYFLRTPISGTNKFTYSIAYTGAVVTTASIQYGIRPCYVKASSVIEHNYTEKITKEPTCTEDGIKTFICICGDSYTESIPATGHNYSIIITKWASCTETGERTYVCICGDSYTETIPATSHNYAETITKEASCTETGERTYTCACGDSYSEIIPLAHQYVGGVCEKCGGKQDAGLYDENDELVASFDELANVYGLDITKYLSDTRYQSDKEGLYYILNHNDELGSAVKLVVPEGVTTIGRNAFKMCKQLRSIVLPDTITTLGGCFVDGCINLEEITIPLSCEFGKYTFTSTNPKLSKFILTEGSGKAIDYVYNYVDCSYQYTPWYINKAHNISVKIADGVTRIGDLTFRECTGLTSVEMTGTVTQIGAQAFYKCENLVTVLNELLPQNLEVLGNGAFYNCLNIQLDGVIIIPSKIAEIPNECFSYVGYNQNVEHIRCILPDRLTYIGESAFSGWKFETMGIVGSDSDIEIPATVTEIGQNAFAGNTNLETVELPYGVESLGHGAFQNCSVLRDVDIPDSVTYMGCYMFKNCKKLLTMYIPDSVERIGNPQGSVTPAYTDGMFYGTSYVKIYCGASSKPTNWFSNWNCYGYNKGCLYNSTYFNTSREQYNAIKNN